MGKRDLQRQPPISGIFREPFAIRFRESVGISHPASSAKEITYAVRASDPRSIDGKYFANPSSSKYDGKASIVASHIARSRSDTDLDERCSRQLYGYAVM